MVVITKKVINIYKVKRDKGIINLSLFFILILSCPKMIKGYLAHVIIAFIYITLQQLNQGSHLPCFSHSTSFLGGSCVLRRN